MCVDIINIKGFRSSRAQMFFKTALIKNFAIFLGKHLCWSLINFVFSSEYCKILKEYFFLQNISVAASDALVPLLVSFYCSLMSRKEAQKNLDFAADPISICRLQAPFKSL